MSEMTFEAKQTLAHLRYMDEKLREVRIQFDALQDARRRALFSYYKWRLGLEVGCTVKRGNGKKFVVVSIRASTENYDEKPWVYGARVLKNGQLHKKNQLIFTDWKVCPR